jgi:hypothetical protein
MLFYKLKLVKIVFLYVTTRKLAFSNQFRDRKISVALETELETKISCVKVKKNPVAKSVAM